MIKNFQKNRFLHLFFDQIFFDLNVPISFFIGQMQFLFLISVIEAKKVSHTECSRDLDLTLVNKYFDYSMVIVEVSSILEVAMAVT